MATPWGLTCLFIGLNILQICNAHPMEHFLSGSEGPNGQIMGALVAVMVSVCVVSVLLACVCCKRRSGFKENENEKKVFRNSPVSASVINETSLSGDDPGHVNPIASAEFTIFTPLSPPHHNNNVFRSQPSVICYTENEAAPALNKAVNPQIDGIDVSEWFADTEYDFPRSRLKYIRELGTGWFGRVVEGEAHGIESPDPTNPTWTPVAVRILESSAPAHEQAQFLHEAAVYRAGPHPNLLRLFGRSLEATPLLLIQEFCPKGDLKKFLIENKECKDSEVMAGVPLRFCCQLAAAVQFLHEHNLPHLDIAARSCQIAPDLSLKLGDYGLAVSQYPNDYYQGTPSIPVRWCAPESVNHTNTTLQPKQVTLEANVWSLAVTFWEICEWGRLPYDWLSDDEVVSQVMDAPHSRLPQPTLNAYYIPPLYRLMEYCWLPDQNRPQINQIYSMLVHLSKTYTPSAQSDTNDFSTENFDLRWESFKPNTIIKTDNARTKSASLTNLHGSFENLTDGGNDTDTVIQMDSWLENVASHTGDMQYVRGLSEAIHELDTALASEQTSSSSSFDATPNSSLGPARSDTVIHMDDSSNLDSFIFLQKRSESGSETEDETWRKRIERGAYSEKVRQKSKSVADLMVLTHIDMNTVKDIFQEELKKLQEERRESLLFVPVQSSNVNSDTTTPEFIDPLTELVAKQEDNLLKTSVKDTKESLVVEPQIITDNKPNSETVPSVSDSKLEEKPIKSTANENTNQETSCNFDTFLQQPLTNKIDTIQSKQTVILTPESGNKDLELNDNFNQSMLSNEILAPKNTTATVNDNIDETTEIQDEASKHIEPISVKSELSIIQDFINCERSDAIITAKESAGSEIEPIPTSQKQNTYTTNTNIETEKENLQLKKEESSQNIVNNKIEHSEETSVVTSEIEEPKALEEKETEDVLNKDLDISDNKIVPQTEEIIEDLRQTTEVAPLKQIEEKVDLQPIEEVKITKIEDSILIQLPSVLLPDVQIKNSETEKQKQLEKETPIKDEESINITVNEDLQINSKLDTNLQLIEGTTNKTRDDKELTELSFDSSFIPELTENQEVQISEKLHENTLQVEETSKKNVPETIEENLTCEDLQINNKLDTDLQPIEDNTNKIRDDKELTELSINSSLISELSENQEVQTNEKLHENLLQLEATSKKNVNEDLQINNKLDTHLQLIEGITNKIRDDKELTELSIVSSVIPELSDHLEAQTSEKLHENLLQVEETSKKNVPETKEENLACEDLQINNKLDTNLQSIEGTASKISSDKELTELSIESSLNPELRENQEVQTTEKLHENVLQVEETSKKNVPETIEENLGSEATNIPPLIFEDLPENILQTSDKLVDPLQTKETNNLINIPPPVEFVEQPKENEEMTKMEETETSNILVQFDENDTESKENIHPVKKQEKKIDLLDIESQSVGSVHITKIVETSDNINKEAAIVSPEELSNKIIEDLITEPTIISTQEEIRTNIDPVITVKSNEFSLIQNFINNERNNNHQELIPSEVKEVEENSNLPVVPSDLTSDLLDTSNVQQINQVFNVFSVTVDHKPPLECFTSPVKNFYARPFDQNEIITDINSLLESERKKYESKSSVCTSSLQNDFLPFVNGISSELSGKIIDILNEEEGKGDNEPKKLTEIALDSLKKKSDEKLTNGHDKELENKVPCERPKKLSEIVLDSMKTNSISEDSGIVCLKYEENGIKDTEEILKNSADSLEDILSNTEENIEDKYDNEILNEVKEIAEDIVNSIAEEAPEKLKELKDNLNKTCVLNEVSQNLPDIILDNVQNKTFVKDQNLDNTFEKSNEEILINVINDLPSLNSLGDNSESAIDVSNAESDKNILNVTVDSSEIILDSLPCNSPVTSESTDNVSDKTVIEVKNSDNSAENNQICDEDGDNWDIPTSTPFKSHLMPKKTDHDNFFSFVSEGDEPSDCQTRVILGPCEEYGLGLYSGLKTTFGKFSDDDRPEEELLQFSSNFMPYSEPDTTHNSVDYSLETWDKFLGKSLQDQDNCPSSVFDNFSPKHDSLDVFNGKKKNDTEVKNEDLNKTVTLTNNETFTIENEAPAIDANMKEDEADQVETTQSSWEPGEGWFLHPQTGADDLTGQIDISGGENVDNSYVGFALDEECVNALRNELAAKLPHAQGMSHEEPQEPEEWDSEERNEIIVKYNVYATPLSPIPEESCCDDVYCDQIQHRDGSDSESEWSEPCLGQTSQLEEDILVVDTETHTALILESPSLREPQHRHTPSQDSCCSNDTLFNLEDLNYGHSPQHHSSTSTAHPESEQILEIEITENENTPKQSPSIEAPKIETEENLNSDSTEMNLTYTKPDINIEESENSNHQTVRQDSKTETESKSLNKLELKLDPNAFGVAPLPSPEDIPWRQLPASLLTYNEVVQNDKFEIQDTEEPTDNIESGMDQDLAAENPNDDLSDSVRDCTLDVDLYSNLTDIRFSGPCDAQLMSTSFSESADYAEERDWDSGSDTRSSSSGEFIWKEGEHEESLRALHAASHDVGVTEDINPMDAIEEENSNSNDDSDDCEEDMEETEFVPSAWDAQATPTKSALRSPEKSTKRKSQQKGVWFKKQKYHCVYEYPREPESPVAPPSDLWRPLSDLSTFADWELDPESCVAPSFEDTTDAGYDVLDKFITRSTYPLASGNARHRDLYQLNPFPDFAAGLSGSDEDFFISSSARPFQAIGQSSQFFPGQNPPKSKFLWQDYQSSSQQSSRDLSDGITPDSGIDDVTPASIPESGLVDILPSRNQKVPPLKCLAAIAANKTPSEQKSVDSSLGGLRHTRNRLKLDLPPSPNSFTSTRTFAIDVSLNDPVINREIPTFTTFGKSRFSVQHVATPTDECPDPLLTGKPKTKNVSFEALPHKPMKLTETVYILDKSEDDGKKPVEMVQGEASLLDSADEDSGIESSANATLERHQQQILN